MLGQVTHALVAGLAGLAGLVLFILAWIEAELATAMTIGGVPPQLQVICEVVIAVLFLVAAVRLFSGYIRVVLIFVLLSLVVQAVTHHEHDVSPPATFHT